MPAAAGPGAGLPGAAGQRGDLEDWSEAEGRSSAIPAASSLLVR